MVDMPRHTSFRFRLDPSVEQERVLSQHVGAARFAFNQALRLHKDAYAATRCGQLTALGAGSDSGLTRVPVPGKARRSGSRGSRRRA
jgi:putative transposase